ncbi:SDR family oxidoreductase [Mucilaginibacter sp. UR6-1]|uniref:SDR family oxidoreductase n=1 Tax=Mucilaginibacter sp. UR6-1 TaxID=1435643 RepID=UPI001E654B6D|nr:SDR family oxidoreductase [Mucilaginibacter sp. UR6-1]MCC8409027.1 SDR family oxidoreductase [Mucilaginibacter sp. UR6-1]
MTISILGCGWYGLALAKSLVEAGHLVKGSTTTAEKLPVLQQYGIAPFIIDLGTALSNYDPAFFECDVIWIAIPPKVRSGGDYHTKIQQAVNLIGNSPVKHVIYISSTGVYGDNNQKVTELDPPNPTTESGKALLAVEDLLKAQNGFDMTVVRFGGLFGPNREAGRFFTGKKDIPNGQAPVNMIHLDDCLGISHAILQKQAFGHTFNACSPQHPHKAEFYTKAAQTANLAVPEFIDELKEWKQIDSVNISKLLHYTFTHNLI